jgi:hypothetical protein
MVTKNISTTLELYYLSILNFSFHEVEEII